MFLTENALKVLKARYLKRDEKGAIAETPQELFRRVAHVMASVESVYGGRPEDWEEKFFSMMSRLLFLPNSPALMNAGKDIGQLAACFVLPVDDSMKSIFDSLKNAALILQSGGGTGFSFSHLRPRSDIVKSTGGIASGPVSFMRVYNTAAEVIKQGGARRGANMGILRVDHPDIMEFIKVKRHEEELSNFNISVAVTDRFMQALKNNSEYALINPRDGKITGRLKARKVFSEMVESAWETGDPGIIFIDRINSDNPTPHVGEIESTNPCGEQPLLPFESCVLGSINLAEIVKTGTLKGAEKRRSPLPGGRHTIPAYPSISRGMGAVPGEIDWELLSSLVRLGVRFLDNTIDANKYPFPDIERMHKGNRKIGLGVMGWADMLIRLGIRYNSRKAFALAHELMGFIRAHAREASVELARERGSFPNFKGSVYDTKEFSRRGGMRNATTTTIAPTGTLSIIAGCSSGIEPLFAIAYKRRVLDSELFEINAYFIEAAKRRGFYSGGLLKKIGSRTSVQGFREIPKDIKKIFVTAHDLSPKDHIEMQAVFQKYTDNAVSKTINLKHSATRNDVARAFKFAYEKGCKGITVFRYGAKEGTLVKVDEAD